MLVIRRKQNKDVRRFVSLEPLYQAIVTKFEDALSIKHVTTETVWHLFIPIILSLAIQQ